MASVEYNNMIATLNSLSLSSVPPETQDKFYSWIKTHTLLLQKEQQPFSVLASSIPKSLSQSDYSFYSQYIAAELGRCYKLSGTDYLLIPGPISKEDATKIFCALYLRRRCVVWVDFGFNVGCEFGGKHPALILRNVGNKTLIVAPISTNNSGKVADADTITFTPSDFCGLPSLRNRFTIVNRITPVSVYRIDTTSPVATLKNKVKFQEVITKFKDYFN